MKPPVEFALCIAKPMKGYYRRNLPHIEKFHAAYFVTFKTFGIFLPPTARTIALRHCLFENGRKIELHAAVIMPNHVHLLFTALEGAEGEPFSLAEIMKGIKGVSARKINQLLRRRGSLWQDESFDRIMRAKEFQIQEKLHHGESNRRRIVRKTRRVSVVMAAAGTGRSACATRSMTSDNINAPVASIVWHRHSCLCLMAFLGGNAPK